MMSVVKPGKACRRRSQFSLELNAMTLLDHKGACAGTYPSSGAAAWLRVSRLWFVVGQDSGIVCLQSWLQPKNG